MKHTIRRAAVLAAVFLFALEAVAFAATNVKAVRFHSGTDHDRVVFDLSAMPRYTALLSKDGRTLTLDFADTGAANLKKTPIHGKRIESATYDVQQGHVIVTLKLRAGMTYKAQKLGNPARLFIDVVEGAQPAAKNDKNVSGKVLGGS